MIDVQEDDSEDEGQDDGNNAAAVGRVENNTTLVTKDDHSVQVQYHCIRGFQRILINWFI